MQDPGLTTDESRKNVFSLLVALDGDGQAKGDLYVDDGISIDNTQYVSAFHYTFKIWSYFKGGFSKWLHRLAKHSKRAFHAPMKMFHLLTHKIWP